MDKSSPRPWGCFQPEGQRMTATPVFPTPVGVFLRRWASTKRWRSLPHARGGVSLWRTAPSRPTSSSPRPWGCFQGTSWLGISGLVFPTPVGVFLAADYAWADFCSLPHARGGVSAFALAAIAIAMSSPRPWGCFRTHRPHYHAIIVFPTPVGVFPKIPGLEVSDLRLPHARGGVSCTIRLESLEVGSSPRPWGCFQVQAAHFQHEAVFPTPVGVFRT